MRDRPLLPTPASTALVAATTLAIALGLALVTGPLQRKLDDASARLGRQAERIAEWEMRRGTVEGIGADFPDSVRRDWERFADRTPLHVDGPEAMARLAMAFQIPGVRDLDVEPRLATEEDGGALPRIPVENPDGTEQWRLVGSAYLVRFRASYTDLRHVLEDLRTRRIPARIERIELGREGTEVAVRLLVTAFSREEVAS